MVWEIIMNILEQFKTAREVYLGMVNQHSDAIIKEIIKDLGIRYPGLTCGTIVGYTPSFNDGEPCEHWTNIEVLDMNEEALGQVLDSLDIEESDFETNNLTSEEARAIETELGLVDVILEEKEGTNYQFAFVIVDGTITFKTGYYDCGY
jgi:hypothetical protein